MSEPRIQVQEIVIDCNDITSQATFWADLLGTRWAMVYAPDWAIVECGVFRLGFQLVPEGKESPKNRLHLDLEVDDLQGAMAKAQSLGATAISELEDREDGTGSVVMQDPEGNEFCLVRDTHRTYRAAVEAALARQA